MSQRWFETDVFRTTLMLMLAGIAALLVGLSNRNVYSKEQVDDRFESIQAVEDTRHKALDQRVDEIASDVRWLVRKQGGTPSAETR